MNDPRYLEMKMRDIREHEEAKCPHSSCQYCESDIVQLIPATGWTAWFEDDDETQQPRPERVVFFGLTRGGEIRTLLFNVHETFNEADGCCNFLGVLPSDKPLSDSLLTKLRENLARENALREHIHARNSARVK